METQILSVEIGARTHLIPNNITHLESDINYTCIHHESGRSSIIGYNLGKIHDKLSSKQFIRINRSCVVNLNFIARKKQQTIWLRDGNVLQISRRRACEVNRQLKAVGI